LDQLALEQLVEKRASGFLTLLKNVLDKGKKKKSQGKQKVQEERNQLFFMSHSVFLGSDGGESPRTPIMPIDYLS